MSSGSKPTDFNPQSAVAPDGTKMVVMRAVEFERLEVLAEDAEDVLVAEAVLKRIQAGEGTVPGEVVHAMVVDGLNPVAAWRRYRGISQAELARRAGISQVWVSRIEAGGGHGTPATRRKLAKALEAPVWALLWALDQTVEITNCSVDTNGKTVR